MLDAVAELAPHSREPVANRSRCGSRWAVAQTHPQAERWALANLERQGYQCFLPLVWVSRPDRVTPTLRYRIQIPLWSSYLLVVVDNHWGPISNTRGVKRLLMSDGRPGYVPDTLVAALRQALDGADALAGGKTAWKPGTPCSLAAGPLYGLPAVVTVVHGSNAQIAIMMLGCLRSVSVPLDCLRARDE